MVSGSFARNDIEELKQKAKERKEAMMKLDLDKLKAKAESGALEGEFVSHLAKKLSTTIDKSAAAQRFLAEERKAAAVVEVQRQLEIKAHRKEVERQREAEAHLHLVDYLQTEQEKARKREEELAAKRAKVTKDIRDQLADNEYRKILDAEAKEQEGLMLSRAAQRQAELDAIAAEKKREAAILAGREIAEANRRFKLRDEVRKAKEEADLQEVLRFQLEKAAKQAEEEKKKLAEKKEKERIAAEMLAKQKKSMDNSAAEDELRAKRHVEAAILKERERAAAYKERQARDRAEMITAVEAQLKMKAQKEIEEKERAAAEVLRIQHEMAEHIQRDAGRQKMMKERNIAAQKLLVEQKDERNAAKAYEIKRPLEERRQFKLFEEAEKMAIDEFRSEVVKRMEKAQMPNHFTKRVATFNPDFGALHE